MFFPEFVFLFELGVNARASTREAASKAVERKQIGVQRLTLADLDRIAELGAPRRIGLGELACAVIAERTNGGVLCDDWKARSWTEGKASSIRWNSIEDVLIEAAERGSVGESDLVEFERTLRENAYQCRVDLRMEYVMRMVHRTDN